ncbi:MAG: insulinase family protein [Bacteroidales bacterium]|nr:insulinase family protein [Bacteroidales bacterium]
MISYEKVTLDNGLRVLMHRDSTTPLATLNLLYCVGSRDERSDRTGIAHLFEHLMFGGTRRYPDFDLVVDEMGGENNAFTNNDYTNYYLTVPAQYIEQALLLEADRMRGDWDIEDNHWNVLEVQQRVVTEEYNQRYMNQPYGDVWMLLRPLCYREHPYRWCTIGADIRHVQEATLQDVRGFFEQFYRPSNAILALAGNFDYGQATEWVRQAFGSIGGKALPERRARQSFYEPEQTAPRRLEVERAVPNDALYIGWVMCDRWSDDYYVYDMISDLLSNGHSSRLYQRTVLEEHLFTEINAYITGDLDKGLFVVSGKLTEGTSIEQAEQAIREEIERLQQAPIEMLELEKVANKFENTFVYSQYKTTDRALSLCYFEMIDQIELVNNEPERYRLVTPDDVRRVAAMLTKERSSTLVIKRKG